MLAICLGGEGGRVCILNPVGEKLLWWFANFGDWEVVAKAMLLFNYIYDYAWDQPELQQQLLNLRGGSRLYLNPPAINKIPEDTQEAVRALVLPDQ